MPPPHPAHTRPPLRSHTHRSAVHPSQTTFHSDDIIAQELGLFDTKRCTDAPCYYYWEVAEFLGSEVDSSFLIFLYICFFVCASLFYFVCLYSCLAFFLVIFVKTAKFWVGHRVGHRVGHKVGHGPGHGLAQVLYTPVVKVETEYEIFEKYRRTFDWFFAASARQFKEIRRVKRKFKNPIKKIEETNFWTSEISKKITANEMEYPPTFPLQDKRPVNVTSHGGKT